MTICLIVVLGVLVAAGLYCDIFNLVCAVWLFCDSNFRVSPVPLVGLLLYCIAGIVCSRGMDLGWLEFAEPLVVRRVCIGLCGFHALSMVLYYVASKIRG